MAVVRALLLLYILVIVGVIVLSWFRLAPGSPGDQLFTLLRRVTDPVLDPVRRVIPPLGSPGGPQIDISVTLVLLVLFVIRGLL
ncbi:YggT family protein [Aquihabitans sp. G128]|uniref:YggT family protein n=1 Tax=Aquihabitans sp. G128 TaxID=2849779 RepID=UPI001C2169DE|nr:YggT family protein [Aquihabitans sp. G128]QXC62263.1 YggT family protein [Aquihabitans sp. G128]